jgi:ATP adenylyltransferase
MEEKYLWAPWRSDYILGKKEEGCTFCNRINRNQDGEDYIVHRGHKCFTILNRYPYNSGHSMIVPVRHIALLEEMDEDEANEFFDLVRLTVYITKKVFNPQSMNIGMNLGRDSGAGIPAHLHMHVVPRWTGDTNFMPVIADTRVVSFGLDLTYKMLRKGFDRYAPKEDTD